MRMRNKPGAEDELRANPLVIFGPEEHPDPRGHWSESFGNNHPIHLEIGTGKGKFMIEMAELHPEINYVAIEKIEEVLLFPVRYATDNAKTNMRFIYGDAVYIADYFGPGEVERIYINFPDPWRKKKHFKRRLTHQRLLDLYKQFLTVGGEIHFKTDNHTLFAFSLEELPAHGFELKEVTFDLHHSEFVNGNVMTGYEERWVSMGLPICRLVAVWTGS